MILVWHHRIVLSDHGSRHGVPRRKYVCIDYDRGNICVRRSYYPQISDDGYSVGVVCPIGHVIHNQEQLSRVIAIGDAKRAPVGA